MLTSVAMSAASSCSRTCSCVNAASGAAFRMISETTNAGMPATNAVMIESTMLPPNRRQKPAYSRVPLRLAPHLGQNSASAEAEVDLSSCSSPAG